MPTLRTSGIRHPCPRIRSAPPSGGGVRPLLTQSDFTYLGTFQMPTSAGNWSSNSTDATTCPLAFRRVNGQERLLSVTHSYSGGMVYEIAVPALRTVAPWVQATVVNAWGDVYQGKKTNLDFPTGTLDSTNITYGLYWDEPTGRLWWNYGVYYNPQGGSSWGCSTLGPDGGTATAIGAWTLSGVNTRRSRGGCLRMPDAFVAANCPGDPMLVGFGGMHYSTLAGSSGGPSFWACPVPDVGTYPQDASIPVREAVDYPFVGATQVATPYRARRRNDYKGCVFGRVTAADATTITLDSRDMYHDGSYAGMTLNVYAGTGAGQSVTLTWVSDYQYSVSPAWTTVPDTTSWVEIPGHNDGNSVWPPSGNTGYWTAGDALYQGVAWIDGPSRQGIVAGVMFRTGRQAYCPGGPHYEGSRHSFQVYDPASLAGVLAGTKQDYTVDPASEWDYQFAGITYPLPFSDSNHVIGALAWDAAGKVLYVSTPLDMGGGNGLFPLIHAFSVNC